MYKGKVSPAYHTKNYKLVEPKALEYKFLPAREEKKLIKTNLGPASYNVIESFRNSQDEKPRFYVSKEEKESFLNDVVKRKRALPSPG